MRTLIVIPARYASTRLPAKPLAMIAGKTLLQRVVENAQAAAGLDHKIKVIVATDDERIGKHADEIGAEWVMTPTSCQTGTDRVAQTARQVDFESDFIINMQGDAPLTPPDFLLAMIDAYRKASCDMITPVIQISWDDLDKMRESKNTTPFSGTTVTFDPKTGLAHWFSKSIIPAVRKEEYLRTQSHLSPVWRHIGLYGYSRSMLETFVTLPEGHFETLEGLEQLRVLEHGYKIRCVPVDYKGRASMSGIDSPEDIARAEVLITKHGEILQTS